MQLIKRDTISERGLDCLAIYAEYFRDFVDFNHFMLTHDLTETEANRVLRVGQWLFDRRKVTVPAESIIGLLQALQSISNSRDNLVKCSDLRDVAGKALAEFNESGVM